MAQKTNLNVSPYFDDFSENDVGARDKNYYKVLFRPGKPIQARELNTLQSILQNQVESFGSHIFKEGSMVIPGNVAFDDHFYAVKVNYEQYGIDVSIYLDQLVGKVLNGQISGISAVVKRVELPNSEVQFPTIYVKYINSDSNFEINSFQNNEQLYCNDNIEYGNTTINAGTAIATTILDNSTATGSSASIGEGVYFVRGMFVRVPQQTIILDYYTNKSSYRVGLRVDETIVTAKDDLNLYDNAKGFTNYAAPGADRFKISLILTKKELDDIRDTDFIELLRVENGTIKKIEIKSSYSLIRDYLAQRTYDESGDYSIVPFQFSINNSLNNKIGNDGIFFSNQKTEQGNSPSDDLMCIKLSPGKAYVKGYDIEKTGVEIIDVDKPRDVETISSVNIPFEMGNLLRVNNVSGSPKQKEILYLHNVRKNSTLVSAGSTVGSARVYTFNLTDAAYGNSATNWDLYLYDIQTYTEIILNKSVSSTEVPQSSFIKGKNSGASGYAVFSGNNTQVLTLNQTSGTFSNGEQILINGVEFLPRTILSTKVYGIEDVKSIYQPVSISGFSTAFVCDTQLDKILRSGLITISAGSAGISTATLSSPESFVGIKSEFIIRYQVSGANVESYNRVLSISPSGTSITLAAVSSVAGVCNGSLPSTSYTGIYSIGIPKIKNPEKGFLYAELPNKNVESVSLNNSTITFSAQSNATLTPTSNTLTVNTSNFNLGISSASAKFQVFDEERYSIFYTDGTIENLTPDKFILGANSDQVTFTNIPNKQISVINATFVKNSVQSKIKQFNKSKVVNVIFSKNPESGTGISTSVNDGLTYNSYYGLRVQDEEISLNYPDVVKVIAVYESLDTNSPVLDSLSFSTLVNVESNAIIGENIVGSVSNCVARVVLKNSPNILGVVYLNSNRFSENELVLFEDSNITTNILTITQGSYRNITNKFNLDKGQKEQYYDYSRLVRKSGEQAPSKNLLIVFDHYVTQENDTGDVFTVNSYTKDRFSEDIPKIGSNNIRSSDTLDFRPKVAAFTSTSASPFDFSSRTFGSDPKIIMSPNESALLGYNFYLGRIDKLYLDKSGMFVVQKGNSSSYPKQPNKPSDVMEIATITLPPYLYNPKDAVVSLSDNRRYTMRDIGKIETRVKNLETVTSLSLLELNTQTLQIQDSLGLNRFKTGFFVDDFKNTNLINPKSSVDVDTEKNELRTKISKNSINLKPVPDSNISDQSLDFGTNFKLFDSNVQKTGDLITLKYESVEWIKQLLATRVENVNPFHVISYSGTLKLNPESDTWIRTLQLEDVTINQTNWVWLRAANGFEVTGTETSSTEINKIVSSGNELYMRSRNTGFIACNLKPLTRFYQFLDGNSSVDFIPKLIEIASDSTLQNYGASSDFTVGETVFGWSSSVSGQSNPTISFRVASSNHKSGTYNDPSIVFTSNPYFSSENIPPSYSASSKTLNVDIESLCSNVQGLYSGYLSVGMKLIGQSSGCVAYVKDLRLISDINGFLAGAFFLRDPNSNPPPSIRIATGSKVYKLTSSSINETPVPGSQLISSSETIYKSEGIWEQRQKVTTTNTTVYYVDPLAQSFSVGGTTDTSNGITPNDDANGAFLTAIDLYFASKDDGNAPLTVEIRTVELGTPTRTVVGKSVTLNPEDINISSDASTATKVTFDYPIYLEPGLEYAVVILAPQTDKYEVWIAEMGEKTIETANLPDSQSVRYSSQFAIGSLFKSQNGSIWTANQYQDLKFKLYKAKFTSTSGSVLFQNPSLNQSNGYIPTLKSNPITILPRQIKLKISHTRDSTIIGNLGKGRKVSVQSTPYNYGYIVGTGSSVSSVTVSSGGTNYTTTNNVGTFAITGSGADLSLNITASGGAITGVSISNPGSGYAVGDVVGIKTSDVSPIGGNDARITISAIDGLETLYLSNVLGESFAVGISTIVYYDSSNNAQSISSIRVNTSTAIGGFYSGNFFKVNHPNHGMYSSLNKVEISNVFSDIAPTTLSVPINSSSTSISIASTSNFTSFEGLPVGNSNPGFALVENEIIKYTSVGEGALNGITRGIDSTIITDHINVSVYKYELGGVSLRRINRRNHTISSSGIDIDSYYVQFDRSNFDSNVTNRDSDKNFVGTPANSSQLSFTSEVSCGGDNVNSSQNIQFNNIIPQVSLLSPSSLTSIDGQIRTVSGTSVNGTEISFIDQQYEPIQLGVENALKSTRIICSSLNEQEYLSSMLFNKSFTLKLDLSSNNPNISPMIFWKESSVELLSNRLNKPISDYADDNRVNSVTKDPHAAIYISNTVRLIQPASSLKVIISAYRHSSADFRVLYSLIRPDSSEIEQSFELFPGYDNLTIDNNQDGYFDVVNPAKNSGLPDIFVPSSLDNQFLEYEFSANNLGSFTGYTIKIVASGTNQAYSPKFKDLRSIALA